MKTAKKLFSLLLVAVLLFSALPFQASAEVNQKKIIFRAAVGSSEKAGEGDVTSGTFSGTIPNLTTSTQKLVGWTVDGIGDTNNVAGINFNSIATTSWTASNAVPGMVYVNAYPIFDPIDHECQFNTSGTPYSSEPATCTAKGKNVYKCISTVGLAAGETCPETKEVETPLADHVFGAWTVQTPASQNNAGVKVRQCTNANCEATETDTIAQETTTVTFIDTERNNQPHTREWVKDVTVAANNNMPQVNDLVGLHFVGWFTRPDGLGEQLEVGDLWGGKDYATTYYSCYRQSSSAHGAGVTVYASVFSGATPTIVKVGYLEFQNGDYILNDLMNNRQTFINYFFDNFTYSTKDYEVADQAFYKNSLSTEKVTDGTTTANGTTSVYIKIKAKNSAAASVQLFVHTKVNSSYALYDLTGFVAHDKITDTYIKNFLKNKTGKNYNLTGMYDQYNWDRLCNGFTSESNTVQEVPADGKLRIHVIAPSYTNANTSSKPASNPATGDMIEVTAAVMFLAAAAVVTLTQLRKRKMI